MTAHAFAEDQRQAEKGPAAPRRVVYTRHVPDTSAQLLINHVEPRYPYVAQCARIEGDVTISVLVASQGTVKALRLMEGHPYLAGAALEAVRQWRYRQGSEEHPAQSEITVILSFRLEG